MSVMRPELIMKSIIPVVMAGIIAIYGLVVAVLIGSASKHFYPYFTLKYPLLEAGINNIFIAETFIQFRHDLIKYKRQFYGMFWLVNIDSNMTYIYDLEAL